MRMEDESAAQIKTLTKKIQCKRKQQTGYSISFLLFSSRNIVSSVTLRSFPIFFISTIVSILACKRRIKLFEESFEAEYGYRVGFFVFSLGCKKSCISHGSCHRIKMAQEPNIKLCLQPSQSDKASRTDIKKCMQELARARKDLRSK